MVGASCALMLTQLGLAVHLIEQHPVNRQFEANSIHGARVSAIQRSSEHILKSLGIWQGILARRYQAFSRMHIQDWSGFHNQLSASDLHEPNLGYLIENDVITAAAWDLLVEQPLCHIHTASPTHSQRDAQGNWQITLSNGTQLSSRLVIGADGAQSQVRRWLGFEQDINDYQQHCLVGTVHSEQSHQNACWQHYSPEGPFALLPLAPNTCSIAWYLSSSEAEKQRNSSPEEQASAMTAASANMLGRLTPLAALQGFPLIRRQTNHYASDNTLLIGDAAHTVHPQAGQGVNLGLLDVIALQRVVRHAIAHAQPLHDLRVLKRVERARRHDATLVQRGMESLNWLFSDKMPPNQLKRLLQPFVDTSFIKQPLISTALYGRLTGIGFDD